MFFQGDRRITIITAPTGNSDIGEPTTPGSTVCEVYADYHPVRAGQINASGRDISETYDRFRIRYRSDIDTTMQVSYGGDTYQIHSIVGS